MTKQIFTMVYGRKDSLQFLDTGGNLSNGVKVIASDDNYRKWGVKICIIRYFTHKMFKEFVI